MAKTEFPAQRWDKKKIILAVFVLLFLAIGAFELKNYVLDADTSDSVKGATISPAPTINLPTAQDIGHEVEGGINSVKEEINKLNVQDLATSSPQIQKIVNDIKALPSVPGQQAKDICLRVCGGL